MEVDDIISYHDVVTAEKAALQKGMNYGVGKNYSVFLMWTGMLISEFFPSLRTRANERHSRFSFAGSAGFCWIRSAQSAGSLRSSQPK